MTYSELKQFFDSQLQDWELAGNNYTALKKIERKSFVAGDLKGWIQFNPARAGSTLANLSINHLQKRPCFLCGNNRPAQQIGIEIIEDFELLVNPYPILPHHFTIVSKSHTPQKLVISTGIELAKLLEGMVVFFNDDGAGASAPDHLHFQAVPITELPLINLLDKNDKNTSSGLELPYKILYNTQLENLNLDVPINAFFWANSKNEVNSVIIRRKSHRPQEFYKEPPLRRAVSPGAIDMAGVIVTPFEQDFSLLNESDIKNIYHQVAF